MNRRNLWWAIPAVIVAIAVFFALRACSNRQESEGQRFDAQSATAIMFVTPSASQQATVPGNVTYEVITATPTFGKLAEGSEDECQQTFEVSYPIPFKVGDAVKAGVEASNCTSTLPQETRIYILTDQGPDVIKGPVAGFSAEIEFSASDDNFMVCGITSLAGDAQWQQGHAQCSPVPSR